MKHIAFFLPTLGGGGAERVTISLAQGLAGKGYAVSLVVASGKGALFKEVPTNITLVDLSCSRVISALVPLSRWLKKNKPDALIATQTHANIVAYLAHRLSGTKLRLVVREVSTPSINLKHISGVRKIVLIALLRHVYERASAIIAVSKGVAKDLNDYLSCKLSNVYVVYNPVITDKIFQQSREPIYHPWFDNNESLPIILAVGRLNIAKNYPLLLRAFAEAIKKEPARLLILGEGEERSTLERLTTELRISHVVSMPGFDSNPFKYMARSRLYVMSSDWEGLPGSLIQALAICGNVISTDCPSGPREVLKNGQYGILVPPGDIHALSSAIVTNLKSRRFSFNYDERLLWLSDFSEESALDHYARILSGL